MSTGSVIRFVMVGKKNSTRRNSLRILYDYLFDYGIVSDSGATFLVVFFVV